MTQPTVTATSSVAPSLVRTVVPYIVGFLASLLANAGFNVDSAMLTPLVTLVAGSAYYWLARLAEQHISPRFGWFLGLAKQPEYANAIDAASRQVQEALQGALPQGGFNPGSFTTGSATAPPGPNPEPEPGVIYHDGDQEVGGI